MKKVFNTFKGMIPIQNQELLGGGYAYYAEDILLDRGFITPMRSSKTLFQASSQDNVVVEHYGELYTFPCGVSTTSWLIDCPRIYLTGRSGYPEVATRSALGVLHYHRLGVPTPNEVIQVTSTADYTNRDENSYYSGWVYTFVNSFGEESSPSPASTIFLHKDGAPVNLSISWGYDASYNNIVGINLYRASSGFNTGGEKEQTQETEFLYVETLAINTVNGVLNITDKSKLLDLGWVLSTREAQEPPVGIKGITLLTDSTVLCGHEGTKIYFSEPDEPHNWREEQELTLEDNIINIKEQNGVLYVMTDGRPYYIDVSKGCNGRECRAIVKENQPLAAIACDGQNSPSISEYGCLYISSEGLVALNKGRAPEILTKGLFSIEQWRQLEPQKMKVRVYQGNIFIINAHNTKYKDASFYFDPTSKEGVINTSHTLVGAVITRTGEFIGLQRFNKAVIHLFAGDDYLPYTWVAELLHDKRDRANVYRIDKEDKEVHIKILDINSGKTISTLSDLIGSNFNEQTVIGRIPKYTATSGVRFSLSGRAEVRRLVVASRMEYLTDKEV